MPKQRNHLLEEIHELERTVADKIQHTNQDLTYEIAHGRTVFSQSVRGRHRAMAKRAWRTIWESSFLTTATAQVSYSLLIPISMLDLFATIYQWFCFPVYGIPRPRHDAYFLIDRHQLSYLNVIEKINCVDCGYSDGVLAFARELASRTEQYWCPIKQAKPMKGCHTRQCLFCDFGDAEVFHREFDELRKQFDDLEP
jgi:hypothetical protein